MLSERRIYEGSVNTSKLSIRQDGASLGFREFQYRRVPFDMMLLVSLLTPEFEVLSSQAAAVVRKIFQVVGCFDERAFPCRSLNRRSSSFG